MIMHWMTSSQLERMKKIKPLLLREPKKECNRPKSNKDKCYLCHQKNKQAVGSIRMNKYHSSQTTKCTS